MAIESQLRFPSEAAKIHAESVAFRALSPASRFNAMMDLIESGQRLLADAPRRAQSQAIRDAEETEWRQRFKELVARHGR
ncbi:MAG: hypothetical protein MI757_10365 [Pirellulales bacterium]|nr:hypothetical protein [Pirellulales bacterium]